MPTGGHVTSSHATYRSTLNKDQCKKKTNVERRSMSKEKLGKTRTKPRKNQSKTKTKPRQELNADKESSEIKKSVADEKSSPRVGAFQ
jgi:hypothetical protein